MSRAIKTKKQLIEELEQLQQRYNELSDTSICNILKEKVDKSFIQDYSDILSKSPAVAFLWKNEKNWPVEYVSENVKSIFGYTVEDFISGKISFGEIIHPDDSERVLEEVTRYSKNIKISEFIHEPYRIITNTGQEKWIEDRTYIRRNEDGEITHYQGIILDISEHKKVELALKESENRFMNVLYSSSDAILLIRDNVFVDCNEATAKMLGYPTRKELLKIHPSKLSPFEQSDGGGSFEKANEMMALALEQGFHRFEWIHRRANGENFPVEVSLTPILFKGESLLYCIWRDITDIKQIEKTNALLSRAIEQADETIVITDVNANIEFVNPAFEKHTGYTVKEAIGLNPRVLKSDKHDDSFYKTMWETLASGNFWRGEIINKKKDGTLFIENAVISPVLDSNGKVVNYIAVKNNITKSKRAEQSIKDLSHIIEDSLNEIYFFDAETFKFIQVNNGACNNIGYTSQELTKMTPMDIKPQFTKELFNQAVEPLKSGEKDIIVFETVHERKNGSLYDVEIHLQMSTFIGKSVFVAIIIDITETKRLQALESRAERLETAGIIAGQVAHDFNNLLAPIMAYPEFIRDELPHNHKAQIYLDTIEKSAKKMVEINQDLLTMGRRGHYNKSIININQIVEHAVKEIESRIKTITYEINFEEKMLNIKGGAAQLHRMLTNILVNAQDAINSLGVIKIKTENYYADDTSIVFGRVPKGEYVKLTISDNGCGIPDDIIHKILDPFFSTKTANKIRGSGLGMSVVDAVIKDHNGYLDLSSQIGIGTSFYLYFPITREEIEKNNLVKSNDGTEQILIVDDDDILREVATNILKKFGYKVNSVESGEKAIAFIKQNPQELIILDMVMPDGIDGAETYRQILEINPNQKAIIASGYSESDRIVEAQKLGIGAFVKKPFTKTDIGFAVRTELDKEVEKV